MIHTEITFRIKLLTCQRHLEGTKPCVHQDPGTPQDTEPDLCLSVSYGGMGQQWPAVGTGALAAADLGGTVCGVSPLGGGHHQPHHRAAEQTTHKLQNNYTKEALPLLQNF